MKTPLKLGGFVAVLAAVLAITFGVGNAVGPIGKDNQNTSHSGGHDKREGSGSDDSGHGDDSEHGSANNLPGGLMVSEHGYTLVLASTTVNSGRTPVTFQVTGPDGQPVTDYEPTHDKDLHFIAVRRDMSGFQHVHPIVDESGTWTTHLDLTPGVWRFFADFEPAEHGETITLGGDISVSGDYHPQPLPPVSHTAQVDDYTVTLDGQVAPGESSELTLSVSRNGEPVTDLQPYLAAYGHLVALRQGDLAYLHVHPEGEPGDGATQPGPDVTFFTTAPSAGTYRLYLDFKHDGVVRTAEFTVRTPGSGHSQDGTSTPPQGPSGDPAPTTDESDDHSDHEHN
jgi:hypothetical protein